MIKAVYFDLDNTLVHRSASIDKFTISFLDTYKSQLNDLNESTISSIIKSIGNGGYLSENSKYSKIFEAIGEELVLRLNWKVKPTSHELSEYWRIVFPQSSVEMPGAKELLVRLYSEDYFLGVISNGAHASREATLASTSFSHLISQLISSESSGVKKPSPEIFIGALSKVGFHPNECIYIGDHPVNDMQGAISAGLEAALLLGFHPNLAPPSNAHLVTELSEVIILLESS